LFGLVVAAPPAHADPTKCLKTVIGTLKQYKKAQLKVLTTCLDSRNVGSSSGPCQGNFVASANAIARQKAITKISAACTSADLATLGYRTDCAFEAATTGVEGQCAALPINDSADFARCLLCWKQAELAEFVAILYASHAEDVCGGDLGHTSTICSDLDCTAPLPDQHNLGATAESDCQVAIGKAGTKYFLSREKVLEKCGLAGGSAATCLADGKVQRALSKAEAKKSAYIHAKCGNRDPAPSPSGSQITWWGFCPESNSCPGTPLSTLDDLVTCVDAAANAILEELLCIQFPSGWPCPPLDGSPSGAFLGNITVR
jgi:hypothetical protein